MMSKLLQRKACTCMAGFLLWCILQVLRRSDAKVQACLFDAGEAQKIDRIMEKFAERYCRDNEGTFNSADGPYLLAFALIMLNTDAHNPRADKKLSCEDFVTMCQAQVST